MGLDNIWQLPEGIEPPRLTVRLCGGMLSGPNSDKQVCTSFRGKVYSDFIEEVTGFTLYEEVLGTEELESILSSLEEFKQELESVDPGYPLLIYINNRFGDIDKDYLDYGLSDLEDLIVMFAAYAKIPGAKLKSWY
jgi:hypothetical protein